MTVHTSDSTGTQVEVVTTTDTQTLTNKTLTNPKINEAVDLLATSTQLNRAAVTTPGTVESNKVIVVDANKQVNEIGLSTAAFIKGQEFVVAVPGFAAAGVGIPFWVAPAACEVVEARERHVTVCDAADTMTIEKVPSGTAPGSGTVVLLDNFTLNSTANTNVTVACHGTAATRQLAAGDALAAKFISGDGTSYAGAVLEVILKWI